MINVFLISRPNGYKKTDTHPTYEPTSYEIIRLCNKNVILQNYIKSF
jgi:hypothetical protein